MADQYVASDKRTGVEVTVTGQFPPHPDDRVRIARTTTLFTRLVSTLLATGNETERRTGFRAVETQLELADALIRGDIDEVRRLVRETMQSMGVTQDQLQDLARQLQDLGGLDTATAEQLGKALGLDIPPGGRPDWPPPPPPDDTSDDASDDMSDDPGDPGEEPKAPV